ncbi:hypothetical protein DY000_02009284 [Brassica cretica]|uniref:Uncharacterized protein n=1 Tax=Brassica cretica TaxID=69181 RepID=A0ABQ7C7E4_BRACR|nr:hypothetical protein DY000_02009284 [Brassica cretica]
MVIKTSLDVENLPKRKSSEGVASFRLRSDAPPVRSRLLGGWSHLRTASSGVGVNLCLPWCSDSFPVTKTCFSEHGGACCAVKRLVGLVSFWRCLVVNEAVCGAGVMALLVALALAHASVCSRHPSDLCVAVRWMYTVPVECNGDGNLRRKPLNDGIVGPRLLLVPPVVSSSVPGFGARPWILCVGPLWSFSRKL